MSPENVYELDVVPSPFTFKVSILSFPPVIFELAESPLKTMSLVAADISKLEDPLQ